jgi:hypothetical protein
VAVVGNAEDEDDVGARAGDVAERSALLCRNDAP